MSVRALPGINFLLSADVVRFNTDMAKASATAEQTVGKIRGAFGKLGSTLGGLGAAFAFGAIIEEASQAEKAFAQLEAGVKSTGGAAGLTATQLSDMATALQKVSTYDDDTIAGAESLLLTFTKIGKDIFPAVTQATLDLATKMGGDLNGAAIQIGKAMQDPVKGVTALAKAGVSFSESQKAMIKRLVDSGQAAKAQQMILKELATEFGGAALAARNTLGGSIDALHNSFNNLLEAIGTSKSNGLRFVFDELSKLFDGVAKNGKLASNAILGIATAAGVLTAAKLPATIAAISGNLLKMFGIMSTGAGLATGGLAIAAGLLITLKDELWNVADQQVTLQNVMIAAWTTVNDRIKTFMKDWGPAISETFRSIQLTVDSWVKNVIQALHSAMSVLRNLVKALASVPIIGQMFNAMVGGIDAAMAAFDGFKASLKPIGDAFAGFVNDTVKEAGRLTKAQQDAANAASKLPGSSKDKTDPNEPSKEAIKHAAEFQKYMVEQQARIDALKTELAGEEMLAKIGEAKAHLAARIGKLSADEIAKLEKILTLEQQLTIQKQLQTQSNSLKNQLGDAERELEGKKEQIPVKQLLNSLSAQGIEYDKVSKENQKIIKDMMIDTLNLEIARANVLTKNTLDGLTEEAAKLVNNLTLTKGQAEIENQILDARKANTHLTQEQEAALREVLKVNEDLKASVMGNDLVRAMQEQTSELKMQERERDLINQHLEAQAIYEREIFEIQKRTGRVVTDNQAALVKAEALAQQTLKDKTRAFEIIKSLQTEQEKYNEKVAELNRLYADGHLTLLQYKQAMQNIDPVMARIRDAAKQMGSAFTNAFDQAIFGGGKLTDVLKGLGKELLHIIAQKALFEPLGDWIGKSIANIFQTQQTGQGGGSIIGQGLSAAWSGLKKLLGFAGGGRPPMGQMSIVGENGPELFMPDRPGTVIPNHMMGLFNGDDRNWLSGMAQMQRVMFGIFGGGAFGGNTGVRSGGISESMASGGGFDEPSESEKWLAMGQIGRNRAEKARRQGHWLQAQMDESGAKQTDHWASIMRGNPGGAFGFGVAPGIANGANDFKGFMDREPELGGIWNQGFINWVNKASGGIGRNSYSVLSTSSGGGIDRGEGSGGMVDGDGFNVGDQNNQYVARGSVFRPYNNGDFSTQAGGIVGPYFGRDAFQALGRGIGPTGFNAGTVPFSNGYRNQMSAYQQRDIQFGAVPRANAFLGGWNDDRFLNESYYRGIGSPRGFANGGDPPVGRASIVGERGPELFVPKTAGTIVPNHGLTKTGPMEVQINNYTPSEVQVQQVETPTGPKLIATIGKMVDAHLNGPGGKRLERKYGLRPQPMGG